ncbi:MAG TPA: hypothetical protein VIK18_14455, partial [Pirellulales bacterium]
SVVLARRREPPRLLKNRARLDQQLGQPERAAEWAPRLLAIALGGFVTYGLAATLVLGAIERTHGFWLAGVPAAHWYDRSAANLVLAYALGMIGANGVCLPSFYFYGLLAGLKITFVDVALHALKGMAAGALALVGALPVYLAAALSAIVFPASKALLTCWIGLALALPFLAGTWGAVCLYEGFFKLTVTIPADRREARRCLLRRFMLAWTGCYTLITPLVIYTLWHRLALVLG